MSNTEERFKTIGIIAIITLVIAAVISFSGPNFLVYRQTSPFWGGGFLFAVFYAFGIASSIGLILKKTWARYFFGLIALIALVRVFFIGTQLTRMLMVKQIGFATTYVQDTGNKDFNLLISSNLESTCERIGMPAWSFTVERDVMSLKPPLSFRITEAGTEAHAYRFLANSEEGIPVQRGKLLILKIDENKIISGWFDVLTKNGRSVHWFRAVWCKEKSDADALKKGEEDRNARLKGRGGITNR